MLLGLAGILFVLYLAIDQFVMPAYTRHDTIVQVPDMRGLQADAADSLLLAADLQVRHVVAPFVPTMPRDAVVDQDPEPNANVKPWPTRGTSTSIRARCPWSSCRRSTT